MQAISERLVAITDISMDELHLMHRLLDIAKKSIEQGNEDHILFTDSQKNKLINIADEFISICVCARNS